MNSVFNQTIEKIEQLIKQVVEMETVNKDVLCLCSCSFVQLRIAKVHRETR